MELYPLADFLFFMLKISDVYNNDGARRHQQIFNLQSSIFNSPPLVDPG
ncbi:hypothetical protein D1BOALGB6SA_8308 [Olavius sp. associated proteobacterium Delta 1]|nr:hypothetical protein D1BOALGB6SA_8308 [Olavius sp. associated proteobacterium Delta 1]